MNKERRAGHDLLFKTRVINSGFSKKPLLWFGAAGYLVLMTLWLSQLIWPLPVRAYYIPAGSMEDTLRVNDRLIADIAVYRFREPKNGEIVVFKAPQAALTNQKIPGDVDFIKRVIGTPGQTVEIKKGKLFVNGKAVTEPYAKWDAPYFYDLKIVAGKVYSREYSGPNEAGLWLRNSMPESNEKQDAISQSKSGVVPPGNYLMLGDYRSNSNDSHVWGFATRSAIEARALYVFWPLSHQKSL
ncbi:MAG: signal peptidase I [Proteobacteria bacterium]|nr:MAG: signal peptidase I [Pseudomonadota bacterium]